MNRILTLPVSLLILFFASTIVTVPIASGDEVVAFWGFENTYDFPPANTKLDFIADVDNTISATAALQTFLGDPANLDHNGGGGFVSYTSPTSGTTYGPTRTLKWDDLKGGGADFDIGGVNSFLIDKNDGMGPLAGDFGNDALMYITLDGTGYSNFQLRFDIEATPGDLADSFDIFYRIGGAGNVWLRNPGQNNIPLSYMDYTPIDPDNQFADSGVISLSSLLNGQSQIEIIISDFAENGNGEMEIDNIELVAIPEPSSMLILLVSATSLFLSRRKK